MEEAQEEVLMNNKSDQQSQIIVKGKRTKRQRPQSPIPFIVNGRVMSPADSSAAGDLLVMDSTEEDEDMANCLILLAQCQSRDSPNNNHHHDQEEIGQTQIHNHNNGGKFSSRRFLEAPSLSMGTETGTGKIGYYVYECKTCNRTFPSFQALGGHRASHKKPKSLLNNNERSLKSQQQPQQQQQQQFLISNSDEEEGNFRNLSSLSLQLSNNNNNNNNINRSSNYMKSNKTHECSICGAEFTSGQALGGHMRRHRAAPVSTANTTTTTLSLIPMAVEVEEPRQSRNNKLSLDLDLNLPAPEDDLKESKLPFSSKQSQQQQQKQKSSLVFSVGPTLVDCHN